MGFDQCSIIRHYLSLLKFYIDAGNSEQSAIHDYQEVGIWNRYFFRLLYFRFFIGCS